MAAVDRLLERLKVLDEVVDEATTNASLSPIVRDHALRAVAIQGLAVFEQFMRERGHEWADHFTTARIPASHLSGGPVGYSDRIVQTLPKRFKDLDGTGRAALVDELARTLGSFSTGSLVGHDLFFAWPGSNVQTRDIEEIVRLSGLKGGWADLTAAWKVVDPRFPGSVSALSTMTTFAQLRHTVAHNVDAVVDPISISAVTRNVRLTALLVDICISEAVRITCRGGTVSNGLASSIKVRAIRRDGSAWPEYSPASLRARRRHRSLDVALNQASLQAKPRNEIVVAYDANEIIDWRTPI